jgi:hypothetical protein
MLGSAVCVFALQGLMLVAEPAAPPAAGPRVQPLLAASAIATPAIATSDDVTYSPAYYRRLAVHRTVSYAILPLFAMQFAAGLQLYEHSDAAPLWARATHRIGATGIAALFATNVATGVPNLVAGLKDPRDRPRRVFHASMMLLASAGFTATGLLSERAERSPDDRDLHRALGLTSLGVATVGYLSMLDIFRGN